MKKLTCTLMILMLLASSFVLPAAGAEELPYYEIDVLSQNANFAGLQSGWFGKLIKDRFNIGLNITATNLEGGASKLATKMATNDLGELLNFGSVTSQDFLDARDMGLLFNMNQGDFLKENAPFITENMPNLIRRAQLQYAGSTEDAVWALVHDALVSGLPYASTSCNVPQLRYDLYKAIGSPEIEDMWDYLPVLKQMQELYPVNEDGQTVYGVSYFPDWDGNYQTFAKWFALYNGYDAQGMVLVHGTEDKTQELLAEDSFYMQGVRWMYEANQLGLLDPDSITQTYSEWSSKVAAGRVLFVTSGNGGYNTPDNTSSGRAILPVPMATGQPYSWGVSEYGSYRTFGIGVKARYPERIMQFIDWLCTDEGAMESRVGPKGLVWDYNADGKPELTAFGLQCINDPTTVIPDEWGGGTYQDGKFKLEYPPRAASSITASTGESVNYTSWSSYLSLPVDQVTEQWRTDYDALNIYQWAAQNGSLVASGNESYAGLAGLSTLSMDMELIQSQVGDVIKQYSWKMAYAENDEQYDSLYAEMLEKAEGLGYRELTDYYMAEAQKIIDTRAELNAAD